jgi:lysyl-tRNA synthetase, class II
MSISGVRARSNTVQKVRDFLLAEGFEEITPQLSAKNVPNEPTILPIRLSNSLYLNTSPEAALKKAMAAGFGNVFTIANTFRDLEGSGPWHSHEFLMAEWYQQNTTWNEQMEFTQRVIEGEITKLWPKISWLTLWKEYSKTDLLDLFTDQAMMSYTEKLGYNTDGASWEQLFNQVADNLVVPHLPKEPFFLVDYPARISPLARPQNDNPDMAERFELYIKGIEIANGNTESFDSKAIRKVFEESKTERPVDEDFLGSIKKLENQKWSGVGLGIDRLAAITQSLPLQELFL